jgi:hypothetical protein
LKNKKLNETLPGLQETKTKISDLTQQLISTSNILKRTAIKSPTYRIVTDIKYDSVGAVISTASKIMYVALQNDQLIIEAQVNPSDIDSVKARIKKLKFK